MIMTDYPSIMLLIAFLLALFSFFLISQIFTLKKEVSKLNKIVQYLLKKDKNE